MTEQEFLDNLPDNICLSKKVEPSKNDYFPKTNFQNVYSKEKKSMDYYIVHEWCVGGVTGGSCWGGENRPYVSSDIEPDFDEIDDILQSICPDITWLAAKKIYRHIRYDDYTQYEYYGNSTNYKIKYICLRDIYDTLKELGKI